MLLKYSRLLLLFLFVCFTSQCFSQCLEIETILVDACDSGGTTPDEGLNEMVRFKVGPAAINTSTMTVSFPSNTWQGLIQNTVTASKVLQINNQITALGGCGQLIEPVGGVLPANAKVILITSFNFSISANVFGPISQNIYVLFQNNPTTTAGHFANYGSSTTTTNNRTLTINFGACSDSVTYDRSLLITSTGAIGAADGASVNFTPAGIPSYFNLGCLAPVDPFTVDAGTVATSPCAGTTVNLAGTSQGYASVHWSATGGSFSAPSALSTTYTIPTTATGTVQLTLTATDNCGQTISDVVNFTVTAATVPNFATTLALCTGATAPTLNATSPNGISGNWNPATISNTTGNTYVFTPTAGQCATTANMVVTVASSITPNFSPTLSLCSGATAPTLNATSPNGIAGTWSPATISNTAGNTYVFTPNSGQCATTANTVVSITAQTVPNFATTLTLCSGATAPALNATSPNGIAGTWNPATISNTTGNTYVFTPNAGQCATTANTVVSITAQTVPNFAPTLALCSGATAPTLNATSPNGIAGTWSPATISNTTGNTYVFTPNSGQCATSANTVVSITAQTVPNFAPTLALCSGATAPTLNATSPNGVAGTWNPATISNTAGNTYVFTPNTGQCATTANTVVSITAQTVPNFVPTLALCSGATAPALNATSPNGIAGTWNPATISNTAGNTYVFTPNSGQCATSANTVVSITAQTVPNFAPTLALCSGATAPTLNATSPNGISGTWNPATISNTTGNTYVFTPTAGQCATTANTVVSITAQTVPNFAPTLALCSGATAPTLNATSPNGISGTWNPATISNTTGNTYVFTPTAGQCATTANTVVSITAQTVPNFAPTLALCSGATAPTLNATSPNGIAGTWSPATISNTAGNTYVFTPTAGQCATTANTVVSITAQTVPNFAPTLALCSGATAPTLNATSPNGIAGTWNPATISNTAGNTYVFTPNTGQCATTANTVVSITAQTVPNFAPTLALCSGATAPTLNATSPNGVAGTWSPATISNTAGNTYVFTPNSGQCATTANTVVSITAQTVPNFAPTLALCSGATAPTLNTTSPNGIAGTWSPATISNTAGNTYVFTPNSGQCATTANTVVSISPNTVQTASYSICLSAAGQAINPVRIETGLAASAYTFAWTKDGTALPDVTASLSVAAIGNYQAIATNATTNCQVILNAVVQSVPKATASATVISDFESQQLIAVSVVGGQGPYSYQLNGGIPQLSPDFTIFQGGEYQVHITEPSGCNELDVAVTALFYPKFFTPNGDGYNDSWNINGDSLQDHSELYIFDRYGKLLKQIAPNGPGWNGTYNGHDMPSTDYWFLLKYISASGQAKEFKANFSLKR